MKTKRLVLIAMILSTGVLLAGCSLNAVTGGKSAEKVDPINKSSDGLALNGYDAVAYFEARRAVRGAEEFSHEYEGARWLFTTEANRDLFANDPQKYAPQYGGYCSWAVGHGYTAPGDPEAWKIVDGKLYLNYNQEVREMWEKQIPALIVEGDKNWPNLVKK
ncbi:MAG TPA: YHS domain-containing (seleno)protein [Blastocatellia bacterium]|nr:YHS domain-containing (seleno)protein [Blastocatellia bacterium]